MLSRRRIWFASATLDAARSQLSLLCPSQEGDTKKETLKMIDRIAQVESGLRRVLVKTHAAQHRMHLTAFGVGMLAFLAGFGVCWLVFVL